MRYLYLLFLFLYSTVFGLTLDDAIKLALNNHPYLKEQYHYLKASEFDYKYSWGNFFPTVNLNFSYTKFRDGSGGDSFSRNRSIKFSWTLYNSGTNILELLKSKESLLSKQKSYSEDLLDIIYDVKKAYYEAVAKNQIYKIRQIQLKAAQKDLELAQKKLELGLVTKADYLQAKVRLEDIRYSLISAEFEYKKALASLNSLIGYPLDTKLKLDYSILKRFEIYDVPDFEFIKKLAFKKRPVFKQYYHDIKRAKYSTKEEILSFTPTVSVSYSLNKDHSSSSGTDYYNVFNFGLSWTIFEGLKRYHAYLSAKENELAAKEKLRELKRIITLKLYQYYMDLKSAYRNIDVARTLLEEADHNYKQAIGEYKAGKGDIISLLTAESSLASAHEKFVNSLLDIARTKATLEREIGVVDLSKEEQSQ
ncbi:TolC family protein [Persephonella sp.]|uniref:TolC family protein n=1 Tax=Persephonella sp. TaxID=2060922 RepID=UPI00261FD659|nr:TolC family protein [Persephonella sp.]